MKIFGCEVYKTDIAMQCIMCSAVLEVMSPDLDVFNPDAAIMSSLVSSVRYAQSSKDPVIYLCERHIRYLSERYPEDYVTPQLPK